MIWRTCLLVLTILYGHTLATSVNRVLDFKDIGCENNPENNVDEFTSYHVEWNSTNFTPPESCSIQFMGKGSQETDRYQVCVLSKSFNLTDCNVTVVFQFEQSAIEFNCRMKPPKSCGQEGKYFRIQVKSYNGYETVNSYPSGFQFKVTAVKSFDSKSIVHKKNTVEKNKATVIAGVVAGMVFLCILFVSILVIVIIIKTKKPKPSMEKQQEERRKRNKILQERSRAEAYRYRRKTEEDSKSDTESLQEDKVNYIHVSESNIDLNDGTDNLHFEQEADDRSEPDGVSDHVNYTHQETKTEDSSSPTNGEISTA